MHQKETRYFGWLLKSRKQKELIKNWLVDIGADVFDGSGLKFNEVIKFDLNGKEGTLWHTGYANQEFIRVVRGFKK